MHVHWHPFNTLVPHQEQHRADLSEPNAIHFPSQTYRQSLINSINAYLGSEPLQEAVKQHLLVQDLKQGVVQKQPLPPGALHKLINDDGDDQVEHDEVDAENEGDAVDG